MNYGSAQNTSSASQLTARLLAYNKKQLDELFGNYANMKKYIVIGRSSFRAIA